MIRQMYKRELSPDEEYLQIDDEKAQIVCNLPEDSDQDCVKCIDCKFGVPVFLSEHLVDGFENRAIKLSANKQQKNLYRIEECKFTKEVRRCALCNKKDTYFTLNSTCEHAAPDKEKKKKEEQQTEAYRIKARIESAKKYRSDKLV